MGLEWGIRFMGECAVLGIKALIGLGEIAFILFCAAWSVILIGRIGDRD